MRVLGRVVMWAALALLGATAQASPIVQTKGDFVDKFGVGDLTRLVDYYDGAGEQTLEHAVDQSHAKNITKVGTE